MSVAECEVADLVSADVAADAMHMAVQWIRARDCFADVSFIGFDRVKGRAWVWFSSLDAMRRNLPGVGATVTRDGSCDKWETTVDELDFTCRNYITRYPDQTSREEVL